MCVCVRARIYIYRYIYPKKQKNNLIKTSTLALMICSKSKLDDEVKFVAGTLGNNGFPEDIVWSVIRDNIFEFN